MSNFGYVKPGNLNELLEIKSELKDSGYLLAGGSNLLVYIKERTVEEGTLIDIADLEELKYIERKNGGIAIGACETITSLMKSDLLNESVPFFTESLHDFANPLIRNKATVGGNLADASPVADTAPPLLVLDARAKVLSANGSKEIPLEEFFTGPRKNCLKAEEMLESIEFPLPEQGVGTYIKFGLREGTSIAVTSVALWLVESEGKVEDIRIALGGVAPRPVRAKKTESLFKGEKLDANSIEKLSEELAKDMSPISDVRGSAEYRKKLTINLLKKAIRKCIGMEE